MTDNARFWVLAAKKLCKELSPEESAELVVLLADAEEEDPGLIELMKAAWHSDHIFDSLKKHSSG